MIVQHLKNPFNVKPFVPSKILASLYERKILRRLLIYFACLKRIKIHSRDDDENYRTNT